MTIDDYRWSFLQSNDPPLENGPFWMKYISMSYLISKLHQPVDAVVYVLNF